MIRKERNRMIKSVSSLVQRYKFMTNSNSVRIRLLYNIHSVYWCDFNDYIHVPKCKHCALGVVDENMDCVGVGTFCDSLGSLRKALR